MPLVDPVQILKNNPAEYSGFLEALSTLNRIGMFELLRERGRVIPVSDTAANYEALQTARANWSVGYNEAIDTLMYFKELFLIDKITNQPSVNFGSLERARASGDLTNEEVEALKNGTEIPRLKPVTLSDTKPNLK